MTIGESPERVIRVALAQRGVAAPDDELEEMAATYPALLEWVSIVELLAEDASMLPDAAPSA